MFKNKINVVLGAGGSIAAYKFPLLISALVKKGAEVFPLLTESALNFVAPGACEVLSHNKCLVTSLDASPDMNIPHIELAEKADAILIAPASANLIARLACGFADDMITDTALAALCPKFIVPAMNSNMLSNEATVRNLKILSEMGWKILESEEGMLACGSYGKGRFPDTEVIISWLFENLKSAENYFENKNSGKGLLSGKKVLVTAGPTCEAIDPVRYITNRSTGKMGYSLAEAAADAGGDVVLISGPSAEKISGDIQTVRIFSAEEMYAQVMKYFPESDILIMAAAVADYRPVKINAEKLKKTGKALSIKLEPTKDILLECGKLKKKTQLLCGFAMESENLEENAEEKLRKKSLDLICANPLKTEGAGFAGNTNIITLIDRHGKIQLPMMTKENCAKTVIHKISELLLSGKN